jgi:anaerobic ribonucleoside-triphosphate reductase
MEKVKAVKTEIYSRVVGYYRPVQDWNRGKQEEFSLRECVDIKPEEQDKKD